MGTPEMKVGVAVPSTAAKASETERIELKLEPLARAATAPVMSTVATGAAQALLAVLVVDITLLFYIFLKHYKIDSYLIL